MDSGCFLMAVLALVVLAILIYQAAQWISDL